MRKSLRLVSCIALATIVLAGCRYSSTYTINDDGTVSGRIYTAIYQDPTEDPVQAMVESDATTIASTFTTATISPHNEGDWVGYFINFTNEPLATFASLPEYYWDVQIIQIGSRYRIQGYTGTDGDSFRTSATEDSGYLEFEVHFPGTLTEVSGADESSVDIGWARFNLLALPAGSSPYAVGNGPSAPPEPEPVVTVVITPDAPDPIVTPVVTPSESPEASPSPIPNASDEGDSSIPVWVWVVGGVLIAALAGMIGFAVAGKKAPVEAAPAAKPKPKLEPKADAEPEEEEPAEEEGEK